MVRTHQPGEAVFRSILPEEIDWKPFPAFPPSARLAVLVGEPSKPGPYVIRVKVPSGVKLMPHKHPEDRIYTVMSGVFYIGLGDQFDGDKVKAFPPGSVVVLPGDTPHFHWAKSGEYVTQVTAIGPLGLDYLDPGDDPRQQNRQDSAPSPNLIADATRWRRRPKAKGALPDPSEQDRDRLAVLPSNQRARRVTRFAGDWLGAAPAD
jgi:quercetin dioxygenase-like cupin family protein